MSTRLRDFKDALAVALGAAEAADAQEEMKNSADFKPLPPGTEEPDPEAQIKEQADKIAVCIHNYLAALTYDTDEIDGISRVVSGVNEDCHPHIIGTM